MADNIQLNFAWLNDLSNPHHDGTTQQIDDFVQAFVTGNAVFNQRKAAVHQARQKEDEVWLTSQRDDVVPLLEAADKKEDSYISAVRYLTTAHAGLPDDELTKAEAKVCMQVFKDFNFSTHDAYGAEADKIVQMQQNLQPHQAFLTQIGAWTFLAKAVEQAQLVRQYLGQRALTKGEFVKGEMKAARRATDQAIADMYKTIVAMMELMPSAELSALYTQLRGIEIYARQYYLKESVPGSGTGTGGTGGGTTPTPGTGGGETPTPDPGTGGGTTPTPDPGTGGGETPTPDPGTGGGETPSGGGTGTMTITQVNGVNKSNGGNTAIAVGQSLTITGTDMTGTWKLDGTTSPDSASDTSVVFSSSHFGSEANHTVSFNGENVFTVSVTDEG